MSGSSTVATGRVAAPATGGERLWYLDALRAALVAMVIVHHASQPYGPAAEGNWPVADEATSDWFTPFWTVNAAIGLGLLFLLAGYVAALALDRQGSHRFLAGRWRRIGVPLVVVVLALNVPLVYLAEGRPPLGDLVASMYEDAWRPAYMHLWFLAHLLLYTAVYVLWRRARGRRGHHDRVWPVPTSAAILAYVVGLGLVTWVIRWEFPVDEWVPILLVLNAEPAKIAQYVSLFALGAVAYRGDWFRRMPRRRGLTWLAVGLLAAAGVYALQAIAPERWDGDLMSVGGMTWGSLVRSTWESVICAGLAVGLVVLFRELVRRPRRLLVALAGASYAAYIVHVYLLVGLQASIAALSLPPFVKFALVAVVGVVLCFAVGYVSRRVPGLRVVLGTAPARQLVPTPELSRRTGTGEPGDRPQREATEPGRRLSAR